MDNFEFRIPSKELNSDRFIPLRKGNDWQYKFHMLSEQQELDTSKATIDKMKNKIAYASLLKNELFGAQIYKIRTKHGKFHTISDTSSNLFQYSKSNSTNRNSFLSKISPSRCPLSKASYELLTLNNETKRKIPNMPHKILDAPGIVEDYYYNLLDWSVNCLLAVGLNSSVYSCHTTYGTVDCLWNLNHTLVSGIKWKENGESLAIGTEKAKVHIWDTETKKEVITIKDHSNRVVSLAWNESILMSGNRDGMIMLHDIRAPSTPKMILTGHVSEVCGLEWSANNKFLASGGNDNLVFVWDLHKTKALMKYEQHTAAVKALAWSPHRHTLLASGGGSNDRTIRFWNTITGKQLHQVDTGSQVCSLLWSKNSSEFVSTHGDPDSEIIVWKYPSLTKVASLTGHTSRALYTALSPSGIHLATGSGDETIRFWEIFQPSPLYRPWHMSVMNQMFTNFR